MSKKIKAGRPYTITTQESSVIFFAMGFLITFLIIFNDPLFPPMYTFIFIISWIFAGISMFIPNYSISKYNLNMLIDRITNPNWENWVRVTKNRRLTFQTVLNGPHGQTKGIANQESADVINRGDFTISFQNGNHAVLEYDVMSHNLDLNEALGWKLEKRKFGIIGANAYKRAVAQKQLITQEKKE